MKSLTIVDVGPRDGLQSAPVIVSPVRRAELAMRLRAAGLERVETVSFVHPQRVPAMAGAEKVVAALTDAGSPAWCGLVLNGRGFDRLVAAGMRGARITFAVSDAFNRRNSNMSTADSASEARSLTARARESGLRCGVVLATAFGCPFSGDVDPGRVAELAAIMADAGVDEILFADTIGAAVPRNVRDILERCVSLDVPLGVHLHDTRHTGYACACAALEAGATILDASAGGLGGCPFAPGATGNIATEDLVWLLEREGITTGIDLDALLAASRWLSAETGLPLQAAQHRASPFPPRGTTHLDAHTSHART